MSGSGTMCNHPSKTEIRFQTRIRRSENSMTPNRKKTFIEKVKIQNPHRRRRDHHILREISVLAVRRMARNQRRMFVFFLEVSFCGIISEEIKVFHSV
jgi:hypothetical protein